MSIGTGDDQVIGLLTIQVENGAVSEHLLDLPIVDLELCGGLVVTENSGARLTRNSRLEISVEVWFFLWAQEFSAQSVSVFWLTYISTDPEVSCKKRSTGRASGSGARRDGLGRYAAGRADSLQHT